MPIFLSWDDEAHTTIFVRYQGAYTWEELDSVVDQMYSMMRSVPHKVHVIALLDRNAMSPGGSSMIARFRRILLGMPRNLDLYINVGKGSPLSNAMFNALMKIYPMPFRLKSVINETEARKVIASQSV